MKRTGPKIGVSALFLCFVCIISSCEENASFSEASESVKQIQETNVSSGSDIYETTDIVQSTQVAKTDESSIKQTETMPVEITQDIAEEYMEILGDGRVKHTFHLVGNPELFSITVPSSWERGADSFSEKFVDKYTTKDSKRMEVSKLSGMTEDQWAESYAECEGPLTGVTAKGNQYIGYYRDPQIEKDVDWRVYYFLLIPEVGAPHLVSIYHNLDKDSEDYLDTIVIPTIESIIIE